MAQWISNGESIVHQLCNLIMASAFKSEEQTAYLVQGLGYWLFAEKFYLGNEPHNPKQVACRPYQNLSCAQAARCDIPLWAQKAITSMSWLA